MTYLPRMRAVPAGKLLSLVGAVLTTTATLMYFLSEPLGRLLNRHAVLNLFCWTALFLEVFGLIFLLIGSAFLALRAQPAVSFSAAVGLLVAFGIVASMRQHNVLRFNERSWTSSLFALSGVALPMSVFYFAGGCIREIQERLGKAKP